MSRKPQVVRQNDVPGAASPIPADRPSRWTAIWLGGLIVAAIAASFANTLSVPFIYDDIDSIPENPHIRRLWPLSDTLTAPPQSTVAGRPVVILSLALNHALSGLNVRGYHLFNITVHCLVALLLLGIIRRTLCNERLSGRFGPSAPYIAGTCALLWAIHPLQTEAVTYIIQRTELLVSMFYLLTLYCFIRGGQSPRRTMWFITAMLFCALGMGTKEVMVSAPLLVLLYDRTFVSGTFRASLRRHAWLYAGLASTWVLLAWLNIPSPRSESAGFGLGVSSLDYLRTQAAVITWYLRLCFWPDPLTICYNDWPPARTFAEVIPQGFLVLAMLAVTAWALWRSHPLAVPAALFFMILAPSSSFIPIVTEPAAERRMYLPLLPVVLVIVLAVRCLFMELTARRHALGGIVRFALPAVAVIAVALCLGWATVDRNRDYASAVGIWTDAVAKRPQNAVAYCNLGTALKNKGQRDEALACFERAVEIKPNHPIALSNLGSARMEDGRPAEALKYLTEAVESSPNSPDAHYNLANALAQIGRLDEAVQHYREAIRLRPHYAEAENNFGIALFRLGRVNDAIEHYTRALAIQPQFPDALNNLGNALLRVGRSDEAIGYFRQAIDLQPSFLQARYNLGRSLVQRRRYDEAVRLFHEMLNAEPGLLPVRVELARALASMDRRDEALAQYQQILQADPQNQALREEAEAVAGGQTPSPSPPAGR
ncbi:MAG TPA: tetratricopeptide repeat protein [Phycisphaerae bacterium]|nr:tetratricopeptide repeat protein [Phycisphaerae bacterium]